MPTDISDRVADKAAAYLASGKIRVEQADATTIVALAHGTRTYRVTGRHVGRQAVWSCSCPAWRRCAHIVAVATIAPESFSRLSE